MLKCGKLCYRLLGFIAKVGLLSKNAETRAGYITDDLIYLTEKLLSRRCGINTVYIKRGDAKSLCSLGNEGELALVKVKGMYLTLVSHKDGGGEALAAGAGAGVNYSLTCLRVKGESGDNAGGVLHEEEPIGKAVKMLGINRFGDSYGAVGDEGVHRFNATFCKASSKLGRRCFTGVHRQVGVIFVIVDREKLLGLLSAKEPIKGLDYPEGEGILHREKSAVILILSWQGKAILLPYYTSEQGVDKAALTLVSRQLDALVYRRKIGHRAHIKYLTDAEAKDVFRIGVDVLCSPARDGGDVIIVGELSLNGGIKQGGQSGALIPCEPVCRMRGEGKIYIGAACLILHEKVKGYLSYIHRLLLALSKSLTSCSTDTKSAAT